MPAFEEIWLTYNADTHCPLGRDQMGEEYI